MADLATKKFRCIDGTGCRRETSSSSDTEDEDLSEDEVEVPRRHRKFRLGKDKEMNVYFGDLLENRDSAAELINDADIDSSEKMLELAGERYRRGALVDDLATTRRLRRRRVRRRKRQEKKTEVSAGSRPRGFFASSYVWLKRRSAIQGDGLIARLRRRCAAISASKLFECSIFVVIFLNVIALSTELSLNDDASSNDVPLDVLRWFQFGCLIVYTIEFAIRVIADSAMYFFSGWNVLDFVIVTTDWIDFSISGFGSQVELGPLRVLRAMRPLRALSHFPRLKALVNALLASMSSLAEVTIVLFFIVTMFAVIGLQTFMGTLRNRCEISDAYNYTTLYASLCTENVNTSIVDGTDCTKFLNIYYNKDDTTAGSGIEYAMCSTISIGSGFQCPSPYSHCATFSEGSPGLNPYNGLLSWDNIGASYLVVFCQMTMSNWSYMMYQNMRTSWWLASIYHVGVILFIGFFAANLFVAVIAANLVMENEGETDERLPVYTISDKQLNQEIRTQKSIFQKWLREENSMKNRAKRSAKTVMRFLSEGKEVAFKMREEEEEEAEEEEEVKGEETLSTKCAGRLDDGATGAASSMRPLWMEKNALDWVQDEDSDRWLQRAKDIVLIRRAIETLRRKASLRDSYLRGKCTLIYWIHSICESIIFRAVMMAVIAVNTSILTLDRYDVDDDDAARYDKINFYCTGIFVLEMILLILAYGPRGYVNDWMNVFDGVIVLLSACEEILYRIGTPSGGHAVAISVFRSVRILRVVRLANYIESLRVLIGTVSSSLGQVGWMVVLLGFVVFIFGLTGFQLFHEPFAEAMREGADLQTPHAWKSIYYSCLNVFQVLTLDNWPSLMMDAVDVTGNRFSILFFIAVVVVGNYLIFFMFIAIVISAFESQAKDKFDFEDMTARASMMALYRPQYPQYACETTRRIPCCRSFFRFMNCGYRMFRSKDSVEQLELSLDKMERHMDDVSVVLTMLDDFQKDTLMKDVVVEDKSKKKKNVCTPKHRKDRLPSFNRKIHRSKSSQRYFSPELKWSEVTDVAFDEAIRNYFLIAERMNKDDAQLEDAPSMANQMDSLIGEVVFMYTFHRRLVKRYEKKKLRLDRNNSRVYTLEGTSCGCLSPQSRIRRWLFRLCNSEAFENVIAVLIVANCVCLCLSYPAASSSLRSFLFISDIFFCIAFTIEMAMKIAAWTFYHSGPTRSAYLEDGYNIIDFVVVVASLMTYVLLPLGIELTPLRAIRTLRPMRVIVRFEKVRIVVDALIYALPALSQMLLFCALVWIMFATLGVSLFKGILRQCRLDGAGWNDSIEDRDTCDAAGGHWENPAVTNFDSVPNAIIFLFTVATGDAWADYMFEVSDSASSLNSIAPLFFVAFILIGSFFQLELFVGVIVDQFSRLRRVLDGSALLTREQRAWVNTTRLVSQVELRRDLIMPEGRVRKLCWRLYHSVEMDVVIMIAIAVNAL
eukprot:g3116.t1